MTLPADQVDRGPGLRVLEIHRPPAPHLRYIDQVVGEGSSAMTFEFGRKGLDDLQADVVHLPRFAALYGDGAPAGLALVRSVSAFTRALKRQRVALVRTVHGHDRHRTGGRWERIAVAILNRATTQFVVLDDSAPTPPAARTTTIPHGHFRERFVGYPRATQVPGRLLIVGSVQLGGNIGSTLSAFAECTATPLTLRLIGPTGKTLAERINTAVEQDARITARVENISTGTMVSEMSAAELVLLPGVERLEEMTVLFAALSVDRPVLVPDSATARALADAIGSEWVRIHQGDLTGAAIDHVIGSLRETPLTSGPRLEGRDLATTTAQYAAVFESAAAAIRRR